MKHDQVFTPDYIVKKMLDDIGYTGDGLHKTIWEPSFGDGAFLIAIAERILTYAKDETEAHVMLDNVYGCEIDAALYGQTINRLNMLMAKFGYQPHHWVHLQNADSLQLRGYKFDFIVGNPPYVRIHDLDNATREYIAQHYSWGTGMTDLYVIFFELCLRNLAPDGQLIFITPNSWLKNASQKKMRKYLQENKLVYRITDYHTLPVFGEILTYPAITHLQRGHETREFVHMQTLDEPAWTRVMNAQDDCYHVISDTDNSFLTSLTGPTIGELCIVQNGIATNMDRLYIKPWAPNSPYIRPVVKASTLNQDNVIIFPYEWNGSGYVPVNEQKFKDEAPNLYYHLYFHKDDLLKRNMEPNVQWFQYARSQGIQNSNHRKFVLKHILRGDQEVAEFIEVGPETLVYSGMYIVVKDDDNIERVRAALSSPEFCKYLLLMGKDMAGGYKSVNTKIVKEFRIGG